MLVWASRVGTPVCGGAAACSPVTPSKLLDPSVPPFPSVEWRPAPSLLLPLAYASSELLKMEHGGGGSRLQLQLQDAGCYK